MNLAASLLFLSAAFTLSGKPAPAAEAEAQSLFDGKSLQGWNAKTDWWRVENGAITAGDGKTPIPHNDFLHTDQRFENFELTLQVRITGDASSGMINSGIQLRSVRRPDDHEMIGYQVDAGDGWWGKLYDESRRNRVIADLADPAAVNAAVKPGDWNAYRILAEGPRIRAWINGVPTVDYSETDPAIPRDGHIGLQIHSGGGAKVEFKDIVLKPLPADAAPDTPRWPEPPRTSGVTPEIRSAFTAPLPNEPEGQMGIEGPPGTAAQQLPGFSLPEGFTIELVAEESEADGIGKFIAVDWDADGRMWSMTALEYPVDANENQDFADQLYAKGGRDKILVFDTPYGPGPHEPRIFAEGLVIPLGILPHKNGVYAQYGSEIRFYKDTGGDGKADTHEVVMKGFGYQDSHLFPHQFTRGPGGWVYLAQGLFNNSDVRRPDESAFPDGALSRPFAQCKLARMKLDGSDFQNLSAGPNNIWGLSLSRTGENFMQEANDMGYPVGEYEFGVLWPTGSKDRLRPYQPMLPKPLENSPMGGTGLSGLALAEDRETRFAMPGEHNLTFYLANPITGRIQIVTATRQSSGHFTYEKQTDFLTSADPRFRPVAVRFGPDGALYIVDWYNKIISHNEVPRNHPERDKTRGRIWRVKASGQAHQPPPRLSTASPQELLAHVSSTNAVVQSLAWQQIADRGLTELAPALGELLANPAAPVDVRLAALNALEDLGALEAKSPFPVADPDPRIRAESIRTAGRALNEADFERIAANAVNDSSYRVRFALGEALVSRIQPGAETVRLAMRLGGKPPLPAGTRAAYDRDFERYLARWALENAKEACSAILSQNDSNLIPLEGRLLAVQALPPATAAPALAALLPEMSRALTPEELSILTAGLQDPSVLSVFESLLASTDSRPGILRALTKIDAGSNNPQLSMAMENALKELLAASPSAENEALATDLARRFRLAGLREYLEKWALNPAKSSGEIASALRALRESGTLNAAFSRRFIDRQEEEIRREAIQGLAQNEDPAVITEFSALWPKLSASHQQLALEGLTATPEKSRALLTALRAGGFGRADSALLERLAARLGPADPALVEFLKSTGDALRPVLTLPGNPNDIIRTNITLNGPFTVETWIKLAPGITNGDNLLGRSKGGPDMNFYDSRLRVYLGADGGDAIIANREMKPDVWTHCAITRDETGAFRIYLDGELDQENGVKSLAPLTGLNIGETNPQSGCAASYLEFRVWNRARSASEIRDNILTSYASGTAPEDLTFRISGDRPDAALEGAAKVDWAFDTPTLITPEQSAEAARKFHQMLSHAAAPGNAERGKLFFAACSICHHAKGTGTAIGPDLSGVGAMGDEAILRNLLTPNAQMESGYYRNDITLKDGTFLTGIAAAENEHSVTLRQPGLDERVIPKSDITSRKISRKSIMPEGLIDAFTPEQLADFFAYLRTLR